MQRRKGAVAEREVAELLRGLFPECSRRSSGEECQEEQGVDLKNTGPYQVQVTTAERLSVHAKFAQIPQDGAHTPLLIHKKKRGRWMLTMELEDWIRYMDAHR